MTGFDADTILRWYCCLHPIEFEMLRAVSDAQAAVVPFILEDVYDAFWLTWGQNAAQPRRQAFETVFGVTHGDEVIEGVELPVVFLDLTFWTPLWLWRFENPTPCADGCYLTKWTNQH